MKRNRKCTRQGCSQNLAGAVAEAEAEAEGGGTAEDAAAASFVIQMVSCSVNGAQLTISFCRASQCLHKMDPENSFQTPSRCCHLSASDKRFMQSATEIEIERQQNADSLAAKIPVSLSLPPSLSLSPTSSVAAS